MLFGEVDEEGFLAPYDELPFGINRPISTSTPTVCLGAREETPLGDHARYLKRRIDPYCKPGRGATLLGSAFGYAYVCRGCAHNMDNAVAKRHCVQQPPYYAPVGCYAPFVAQMRASLSAHYHELVADLAYDWILRWPLVKQLQIAQSLVEDELLPEECKAFVKREIGTKYPKKARAIQCYVNLATQAEAAARICALQKAATQALWFGESGYPGVDVTFGSGLNGPGFAGWAKEALRRRSDAHFYERDGANWDSTMGEHHFELCMGIYSIAGGDLVAYLRRAYTTTQSFRNGRSYLSWRVRGTRRSGHNDTTISNSLVNAGIIASVCGQMRLRASIIVTGDDALVAVEGPFDAAEFARLERSHGINPEYRQFRSIYDVSFVSGYWWPGVDGYVFAPKPGRLLQRLFWTVKDVPLKRRRDFITAVARGLLPTCHSLPIIGIFLRVHVITECAPKFKFNFDDAPQHCSTDIYEHFADRYGVSVVDLRDVEDLIVRAGPVPGLLRHWVVDAIIEKDCGELSERTPMHVPF